MTLATRRGEQANQEKAASNFNKCPQLLLLANITSKAEVPGNTPDFILHVGVQYQRPCTHIPTAPAALQCSQAISVNCFDSSSACGYQCKAFGHYKIFLQAHFESERKIFSSGKSCSKQQESL